jgi:hypothetical protein
VCVCVYVCVYMLVCVMLGSSLRFSVSFFFPISSKETAGS